MAKLMARLAEGLTKFAGWMDRPGWPGWVTFGPNGKPLAWAPTERIIKFVQRRIEAAHDHERCGGGWI